MFWYETSFADLYVVDRNLIIRSYDIKEVLLELVYKKTDEGCRWEHIWHSNPGQHRSLRSRSLSSLNVDGCYQSHEVIVEYEFTNWTRRMVDVGNSDGWRWSSKIAPAELHMKIYTAFLPEDVSWCPVSILATWQLTVLHLVTNHDSVLHFCVTLLF